MQAATAQSPRIGEEYDRALRHAFGAQSRPIQTLHELIAIAATITGLDTAQLQADLRLGTHRDITVHWQGGWASRFPVVDRDEAGTIDTLLRNAASLCPDL